ncbi:MAG TPA: NADH:flavin oxidoreductase [Planctomycetota bacterium]|nr:NADH:flavin oxidoreductase [Planctomycetota bacterium]
MPKWFDYKTPADLRAAAIALGVGGVVEVDSDLSCLLQPIEIGGRKVGNRLAIHPMEGCDGELDGRPGELTFRRWKRFGNGGCKLIWGEAVAILDEARANARQLWIHEGSLSDLALLLDELKREHRDQWGARACGDLLVGCQLTHSGRYSHQRPLIAMHDPSLDPATLVPNPSGDGKIPMPPDYPVLSDDELKRAEDAYIAAAKLAVKLGFDFIDLKQCHRYLLNELLAANERPGPYGGSFENRTRLVRNIVTRIRDEVSKDIVIASRINVCDFVPYTKGAGGRGTPRPFTTPYKWSFGVDPNHPETPDLTEPKQLVALLKSLGVCLINVSMGNPYNNMHFGRPFEKPPLDGYESPEHPLLGVARHFKLAGEMQREFPELPMIGTGYSWLQHLFLECGAANVKKGRISMVGVGRGAFAYPDFVKDIAATGKIRNEQACIAVSSCTALMRAKGNEYGQYPSGCVPKDKFYGPIYREAINAYKAGNKPKKK